MTNHVYNPLVSIIVPVYNAEKYIEECLISIKNQKYDNIETIIIDDGSYDGSKKIIEKYDNLKYYYQENGGQGKARNYGVNKAKGEWICFCDADDYLDENYVSRMVECIDDNIDIVVCNIKRITEDGKENVDNIKVNGIMDSRKALININPGPTNKLFRKELFNNNKFLEGKIRYEDLAIFPKLMIDSRNVCVIDDILYYYRVYDDSTMRKWDNKIDDIFMVIDTIYNSEYYNSYKEEIDYLIFKHCLFGHLSRVIYFDRNTIKKEMTKASNYVLEKVPNYKNNKYIMKDKTPWFYIGVRFFELGILNVLIYPLKFVEKRITR